MGLSNTIKEAVIQTAKREWQHHKLYSETAVRYTDDAREATRVAEDSRKRWEDCIDFLDQNFPDWEDELSDEDRKKLDR